MTTKQPARHKIKFWRLAGFCILLLSCAAAAQTPSPRAEKKSDPTITADVPSTPPPPGVSGQQLVHKAEATLRQAPGSAAQAISLYQMAAQAFQLNGEIESAALAWHRVSLLANKVGYRTHSQQAAERARMLLQVRTLPTSTIAGLSTARAARAYLTLGRIQLDSGETKEAIESYQTGLERAVGAQLPREAAAAFVALGLIAAQAQDFESAILMTSNSLDYWRGAKDFSGEALALHNLARFHERSGDLQKAADYDQQAVSVTRFSRNYQAEGESLLEAMRVQLILGNLDAATQACEQLIVLARLSGDRRKESERTMTLATLEAQRDHLFSAYQLLLKSFLLREQVDDKLIQQIKASISVLSETQPLQVVGEKREQLLNEAEFEAGRGDFSAAYQLLLRALLMNDGKSDVLNATLNPRIKKLSQQIEMQQKKLSSNHP